MVMVSVHIGRRIFGYSQNEKSGFVRPLCYLRVAAEML